LLVAEVHEAKGFNQVDEPVATYRAALDNWAEAMFAASEDHWDWHAFWVAVAVGNPRVPPGARDFVQAWVNGIAETGHVQVADAGDLRRMVELRVARLRAGRAVLANEKLLALWGGSSGSGALVYRWGTVRQLVLDVQEGLGRVGA